MKTKQLLVICAAAILICGLTACKKSTKPFVGEYTYQTDGKITISLATEDVDIPWSGVGQMQILKDKDEKGKVIIVKKSLSGDISTYGASISGNEITVDEYTIEKEINAPNVSDISSLSDIIDQILGNSTRANEDNAFKGKAKITVNSKGRLYDNTIIFEETYSGLFYETSDIPFIGTIKSNDLKTIAKLNE